MLDEAWVARRCASCFTRFPCRRERLLTSTPDTLLFNMHLGPQYYSDFFERVIKRYGDLESLSHPLASERIQRVNREVLKMRPYDVRRLNQQRFFDIQAEVLGQVDSDEFLRMDESVRSQRAAHGATPPRTYPCGAINIPDDRAACQR